MPALSTANPRAEKNGTEEHELRLRPAGKATSGTGRDETAETLRGGDSRRGPTPPSPPSPAPALRTAAGRPAAPSPAPPARAPQPDLLRARPPARLVPPRSLLQTDRQTDGTGRAPLPQEPGVGGGG